MQLNRPTATLIVAGIATAFMMAACTGTAHQQGLPAASSTLSQPTLASPPSCPKPTATEPIVQSICTYSHEGLKQQYVATAHEVTETWWSPDKQAHTYVFAKVPGRIVGIDKVNVPGLDVQALYIATQDSVWETWWSPNNPPRAYRLAGGLHGIQRITATISIANNPQTNTLRVWDKDGLWLFIWTAGKEGVDIRPPLKPQSPI